MESGHSRTIRNLRDDLLQFFLTDEEIESLSKVATGIKSHSQGYTELNLKPLCLASLLISFCPRASTLSLVLLLQAAVGLDGTTQTGSFKLHKPGRMPMPQCIYVDFLLAAIRGMGVAGFGKVADPM